MTLLIGIASGGTIRSETVTSLIGAMEVLKSHNIDVGLSIQIGGYVARNRNALVDIAKDKKADLLMFIDNDMVFQPSAIQRLIDADKDVIGANYNARGVPGKPIVSTVKLIDPENDPNKDQTYFTQFPDQLSKVWAVATGFMIIKMSVFEKLQRPYFVAWEDESGNHHTEDVEFCKRCHEVGVDVWLSPTISIKHIGTAEY